MRPTDRASGDLAVGVERLGLGTTALGNLFSPVTDEAALATVRSAWDLGIRVFDTAPLYGFGVAESRLGAVLEAFPRSDFQLSTKVGRLLEPRDPRGGQPSLESTLFVSDGRTDVAFDFSGKAIEASLMASLERLQTEYVDTVFIHDPDDHYEEAIQQSLPKLIELQRRGIVGAVGVGMNQTTMLDRFLQEAPQVEVFLVAGRYTLLDRSGEQFLDACADANKMVLLGGMLNSGILASPVEGATYDYVKAPEETIRQAIAIKNIAHSTGCTLLAGALQFGLRHPAVQTVLVGARSPGEVKEAIDAVRSDVPDQFWASIALKAEKSAP